MSTKNKRFARGALHSKSVNFKRVQVKANQPSITVYPSGVENANENAYIMQDEIEMNKNINDAGNEPD